VVRQNISSRSTTHPLTIVTQLVRRRCPSCSKICKPRLIRLKKSKRIGDLSRIRRFASWTLLHTWGAPQASSLRMAAERTSLRRVCQWEWELNLIGSQPATLTLRRRSSLKSSSMRDINLTFSTLELAARRLWGEMRVNRPWCRTHCRELPLSGQFSQTKMTNWQIKQDVTTVDTSWSRYSGQETRWKGTQTSIGETISQLAVCATPGMGTSTQSPSEAANLYLSDTEQPTSAPKPSLSYLLSLIQQ